MLQVICWKISPDLGDQYFVLFDTFLLMYCFIGALAEGSFEMVNHLRCDYGSGFRVAAADGFGSGYLGQGKKGVC